MVSLESKYRGASTHARIDNSKCHFHKFISYFVSALMYLFLSLIKTKGDEFYKSISSFLGGWSKALKLSHQDYK
jgi:hypothetical protein